jgi:hypothetical protein
MYFVVIDPAHDARRDQRSSNGQLFWKLAASLRTVLPSTSIIARRIG